MFTRAGVYRFRIVCHAYIGVGRGGDWFHGRRAAFLLRFVESGELAWATSLTDMLWPVHVGVRSVVLRNALQQHDAVAVR